MKIDDVCPSEVMSGMHPNGKRQTVKVTATQWVPSVASVRGVRGTLAPVNVVQGKPFDRVRDTWPVVSSASRLEGRWQGELASSIDFPAHTSSARHMPGK